MSHLDHVIITFNSLNYGLTFAAVYWGHHEAEWGVSDIVTCS